MWFNPDDLLIPSANSANSEVQISKLARLADPLPVETIDSSLQISKLAELAAPIDSEINNDHMWFEPGELSKTKTNPLANFANPANYEPENIKSVLPISKLAELAEPLNPEIIINGLLSAADQQKIMAWLVHIEEEDQETIAETLDRCESDPEALAYFLCRADEAVDQ